MKHDESVSTTKAAPPLANFEAYARQVCLYYSGPEHGELKQLLRDLGRIFGTKNQSETVLETLRRMYECEVAVERLFRTARTHD